MKTVNTNHLVNLKAISKSPRSTIVISFDDDDTDLVYISSHSDGSAPDGELHLAGYLEKDKISNQTQSVDVGKSTSTLGKFKFSVIDKGGAFSTLIGAKENAGFGLRKKRVVLYTGFKGDLWQDYEIDSTYIIDSSDQDELSFMYDCTDVNRLTRTKIFTPKIQYLRSSISASEKTFSIPVTGFDSATNTISVTKTGKLSGLDFEIGRIIDIAGTASNNGAFTVDSTTEDTVVVIEALVDETVAATASHTLRIQLTGSDLASYQAIEHDSQYEVWPGDTIGLVKIGEEIFLHDGPVQDVTYGYCIPVRLDGRGVLDTKIEPHEFDTGAEVDTQPEVKEVFYIEGAGPKIALSLLTGTLYGQTGTLPDNMHCAVPAKFIRTADFVNIGLDLWNPTTGTGRNLQFIIEEEVSAKDFIEKQIMLWLGCFTVIHADGSLGIKKIPSMKNLTGYVATIDNSLHFKRSSLKRKLNKVLNQIIVKWGKIVLKDKYTKTTPLVDATSIGTHKVNTPKVYHFDGVRLGASTDENIRDYLRTWRDLYAAPPYELTINVMYKLRQVEVGDALRVNLPEYKDVIKDQPFDRVMMVTSANYNPMSGDMRLTLIGPSTSPSPLLPVSASVKLDPAYYTPPSPATELGQAVIAGGGAMTGNVITSSPTLIGSPDMNSLDSVFYYAGDIQLADGVDIFIYDNVNFRINGYSNFTGNIISIGSSNTGGSGEDAAYQVIDITGDVVTFSENADNLAIGDDIQTYPHSSGRWLSVASKPTADSITVGYPDGGTINSSATVVGLTNLSHLFYGDVDSKNNVLAVQGFGINRGEGGLRAKYYSSGTQYSNTDQGVTDYAPDSVGEFSRHINIVNNGDSLGGLPTKFTGTGGTGGKIAATSAPSRPFEAISSAGTYMAMANGGAGGDGGAGFLLVCKGAGFGINGGIDLTGESGTLGDLYPLPVGLLPGDLTGSSGTGGNPGFALILYDGDYTVPNIEGKITSQMGATPTQGVPIIDGETISVSSQAGLAYRSSLHGSSEFIYGDEDAGFQYLPANLVPSGTIPDYSETAQTLQLVEVLNSPQSAEGNLSTIEITVTAPSDTSYAYSNIYYRLQGDTQWTFLLPAAGASVEVTQIVSSDGATWEYLARPVSLSGNENNEGLSAVITTTNVEAAPPTEPQLPTWLPLATPANLALLGGGTEFTGKACHIVWDYDATASATPQHFLHYKVEVYNASGTDTLQRTFVTSDPWFEYTEQMATEDGGPYRELRFDIVAVGRKGHESSIATANYTNPQAGTPLSVTLSNIFQAITMNYTLPNENDLAGILVYINDVSGFTADADTLVYDGQETSLYLSQFASLGVLSNMVSGSTYYVRYGLYDSFGVTGVTLSAEQSITVQGGIAAADVSGLSAWATRTTAADAAFIAANIGNDAITSTQIASIVAGKITTGTLSATLTVSGLLQTAASGWRVDVGPVIDGPDTFVLRYHNGLGNSKFQMDSLGNISIDGTVTIGATLASTIESNAASGATFTSGDAGALATANTADFATQVSGAAKPANNATVGADWNSNLTSYPGDLAVLNINTTKTDVGLSNVDNQSAATIQAGTTKANVGLGSVSDLTPSAMAQTGLNTGTTITGGGIQLNGGGSLRTLGKSYGIGNGVFFGWDATAYKLDLTSTTNSLRFNGTDLDITGTITGSSIIGGSIVTATSGKRVDINVGGSNEARFYDSLGVIKATIGINTSGLDTYVIELTPGTSEIGLFSSSTSSRGIVECENAGLGPGLKGESLSTTSSTAGVEGVGNNGCGVRGTVAQGLAGVLGESTNGSVGVSGVSDSVGAGSSSSIGVKGDSVNGTSVWCGATGSTGAPLRIEPYAASAAAPTHSSSDGDFWVTSAGVLYYYDAGWTKVVTGPAHQADISTTTGEVSSTTTSLTNIILPGGSYGFYPRVRQSNSNTSSAAIVTSNSSISSTYAARIALSDPDTGTTYADQTYVNASPPYDLGDGEIPLFIFALVENSTGNVVSMYTAQEAPWHYNGPTCIIPDGVDTAGNQYRMIKTIPAEILAMPERLRYSAMSEVIPDKVELTQAIKNQDMDILPHPFDNLPGHTAVLLDPMGAVCEDLIEAGKQGEDIHDIFYNKFITVGNTMLKRSGPAGLLIPSLKWKNSNP